MTDEKILEVLETYRAEFESRKIGKRDFPHDKFVPTRRIALEHCHGMLGKITGFVSEERRDKVMRWLGFVQGILWICRIFTLDQLKNHNRPDPG